MTFFFVLLILWAVEHWTLRIIDRNHNYFVSWLCRLCFKILSIRSITLFCSHWFIFPSLYQCVYFMILMTSRSMIEREGVLFKSCPSFCHFNIPSTYSFWRKEVFDQIRGLYESQLCFTKVFIFVKILIVGIDSF